MNDQQQPGVYVIVVGVDYSDVSGLAVAEAARLARQHARSQIHVVHAVSGSPPLVGSLGSDMTILPGQPSGSISAGAPSAEMARDIQSYVEKVVARSAHETEPSAAASEWTTHLRLADPAPAIAQVAADTRADLVVVGTHSRHGLARFLLGSVAEGVVRLAPCPVLVMRPVGAEADTDSPKIEPACPECIEARRVSEGAQFWCTRHLEHHNRAHTYRFTPFRDTHQSGLLLHPLT